MEIQNIPKKAVSVEVGDLCLVEDFVSNRWYRGRVQKIFDDLVDVFLLDHGNILTVGANHLSTVPDSLLMLPPKIVCGFIANVLPDKECWDQPSEAYFSSLMSRNIKGYIHGFLPHKVLILEVPEITKDLLRLSLGRHVDTDTFLLLVELVLEVPVQQSCESVPDLLIEKQIAQEISFKSSNLCGYENILSLCGSTLVVGQKERVRIAAAVNPGLFYCQLSSAAKDLKEMSEKLALVIESRAGDFRDKPGENMGLLCAIKGKDEKWHRGLVQSLPVNSHVQVVFVDSGYCETVKVESIFQLPSDFLLRPVMTFPCSLSWLGDKDKGTENQQLLFLRNGLLGKELLITVDDLSKEKVCSVTLSDVVKCAPMKTLLSKEVIQMASSSIAPAGHRVSCISNETEKVGISKNLAASEHVRCGSVFEGYVEHVQSPHDFWVRTAMSNARFEAMMNKLTYRFRRLELNKEILQDPVPGQLCCAMYEKDMHYYRALVVDILDHGAEVFFIDFGNTEKVPSMLIKKIPTEFTVEPAFAFNCSLAHLVPLKDVWTASTTDFFRKVTLHKALLVRVIYRRSDVFVVELYEKGFEKSESITTVLTNANMAEFWTYSVIKTSGTLAGKKNKMGKAFVRGKHAENSCKKKTRTLHSQMTKQETATDKQVHDEIKKCSAVEKKLKGQTFKPGAVISVQCSHISSPSDFWCQDKKSKNDLDRLMERLQTFYQANTSVLQPSSACCAVQSQLDNKWYRGCILGGTDSNIKVILVDYGIVVQVKLQNLRALNPEFLELESQAFRCSLYNLFDPVGGEVWSNEACNLLKDFTSEGLWNLKCQVYSKIFVANKGFCNVVDLFTPLQRASTHLVEKGVAKEVQRPNQLLLSVCPCSFVYSSFDITIGSEELVFPTHVVSPWEIYFQLEKNTKTIEKLMDMAMKESEELMSQMHTSKTGSVCLAKYSEDGKWYRSLVWPAQSSLHLNVFFVDYGGKQAVEKKNVLTIPMKAVDLLLTPMQALRCSLLSIPEEDHLPEVNTWIEKATLNKGLRAKFAATNNNGHFICDLFDGDIHINEKVKEIFEIHRQSGKSVIKPISDYCQKIVNVSSDGNKFKTKRRHQKESVDKSQRTPGISRDIQGNGQSCVKQSPKFKSVQKSHSVNNTTAKNDEGKEKHRLKPTKHLQMEKCTIPRTSNIQSSKVLPKVSGLPAIEIAPGFRTMAFISHKVDSVDSFFIQMEKDEQNILKMREELNSSHFTKRLQRVGSNVEVGDLVAARYDEDLAFYRAAVKSVTSSGYITVEFIDYGNTATVDIEKIKPLTRKFLSEARLSIHCKLSKKCDLEGGFFLSDAHYKPVIVEFKQNFGYAWEVSIQGLDSLHDLKKSDPAEGSMVKVSDSDQAKQKQEMCAAVYDDDDTSLTISCEKTKAEIASIKNKTTTLERKTKDGKAVQENIFKKERAKRTTGFAQKIGTNRKACAYKCKRNEKQDVGQSHLPQKPQVHISGTENDPLNMTDYSCGWSVERQSIADAQDIILKKCQPVVHQPISELKCFSPMAIPEKMPVIENEVRRLSVAPVKKDHEYSGFAAAVTTPGEFYVVLEDLFLIMSTVSNVLEDLPEDLPPLQEAHLIPGTGCLVKSKEKKKWCRAEIKHCDDISVILSLVDYAYFVHLACEDVCNLKVLPDELAELPKITYSCVLRGIKPADELQWSDHAAMFFQQCMYKKNLKIYFRQQVSEGQWVVDVTSDRNVAKELVDAGYADYIDNVLGIRFQQRLGHIMKLKSISVDNVHIATSKPDQTQSKIEKVPHGYLEKLLSNDEVFKSYNAEMDTEDPIGESSGKHGSAQKTYGLQSTLSQCKYLFMMLHYIILTCYN